jgi:hypothetical protein
VTIFLPPDLRAPGDRRFSFMHELGHVFAQRVLDAGRDYDAFERITGDTRGWERNTGTTDRPDSPSEQVAQAYARCSFDPLGLSKPADVSESDFTYSGWNPTLGQHRRACALFRRAAARRVAARVQRRLRALNRR